MMTMKIIFIALPLTMPFQTTKEWNAVMPNDEYINNEIIINNYESLDLSIDTLQN